jgi:hypothetical protein
MTESAKLTACPNELLQPAGSSTRGRDPRNARYQHAQRVRVVIEVEVAYTGEGLADALRCAAGLADGREVGGAGARFMYNAVRIGEPQVIL